MPPSPLQKLSDFGAFLYARPLVFFLIFLAVYRIHIADYADYAILSAHPFALHPDFKRQFLHSSPATFLWGWPLTLAFGPLLSFILNCALGLAALALAARLYLSRFDASLRTTALYLILLSPVLVTVLGWIGKSDPYLLAAYLILVTAHRSRIVSGVAIIVMVLCHRDIGTVMALFHCLLRREARVSDLAALAAGNALILTYHYAVLPHPPLSRLVAATFYDRVTLDAFLNDIPAHLALTFNWFWLPLLALSRPGLRVLAVVLVSFALTIFGLDYTRDFTLLSFPLVLFVTERLLAAEKSPLPLPVSALPLLALLQLHLG